MYPPADGTHSSPPILQTMSFCMVCCHTSIRCVWWMLFCNVFPTRRCHSSRRSNWLCSAAIVVSLSIPFTASTPMATNIRCVHRWSFNSSVNHVITSTVRALLPAVWNSLCYLLCSDTVFSSPCACFQSEPRFHSGLGCTWAPAFLQSRSHCSEACRTKWSSNAN